nr:MAG TPA_asm: hypothetical protein [Caudoviricetes sp.]
MTFIRCYNRSTFVNLLNLCYITAYYISIDLTRIVHAY